MMEAIVHDIAALFGGSEVPRDETGSLRSVATLLESCDPVSMLLADGDGNVLVAEELSVETDRRDPGQLAIELGKGLIDRDTYLFEFPFGNEVRMAFAIRLSDRAERAILGGVVRHCGALTKCLSETRDAIAVCGELARIAVHERSSATRFQTRVQHLVDEQDTLKAAHTRAISDAIAEREERLREQQEHMLSLKRVHLHNELILNSAGEGIFGLDRQARISFVNPAGAGMLGHAPEKLLGELLHQVLHHAKPNGKLYALGECPIHRTLRDGTENVVDSGVFRRNDDSSLFVEYTSTPIRDDLEIIGAVLTFRDMSERRALERQLAQAQKLESIGQLAAGVAHEINTPTQYIGDNTRFLQDSLQELNALLGSFGRLLDAARTHAVTDDLVTEIEAAVVEADLDYLIEEMPRAVEQSLEGVGRVATIVRSMKEFSHPGSDEKQAVDLNRALENTLTVSRNEWKYVAESVTDFDVSLPQVNCLPGECNQVFLNLIINAAHAVADKLGDDSQEKGTIQISTRHEGNWAEIRVQDNGTGIPEEARAKVMDPFFTTKEVGRGTGQGLAIAHSVIVDKHGGKLAFETETGKGTTFIIRLPVGQESPSISGIDDDETDSVR